MWHDGVMLNNELVLKAISRHVFPNMGVFSADGRTRIGLRDVCLSTGDGVAWLTVSLGRDHLFQIEVRGSRVKAAYALPAVMERGDGEREYGTAFANSRCWRVHRWSDVAQVYDEIQEFFENTDEFLEEEAKVEKILENSNN